MAKFFRKLRSVACVKRSFPAEFQGIGRGLWSGWRQRQK